MNAGRSARKFGVSSSAQERPEKGVRRQGLEGRPDRLNEIGMSTPWKSEREASRR